MPLQPLAVATEYTLSPSLRICAQRARHASLLLSLFAGTIGCRDTFAGFGLGPRAHTNVDQLFGALGQRHAEIVRNPKYEYARLELAKHALLPSHVFRD